MTMTNRFDFRIIVGEKGNEQGHIVSTKAGTEAGARRVVQREIHKYQGECWFRIEYRKPNQDETSWRTW